jgi:hypothetical protein
VDLYKYPELTGYLLRDTNDQITVGDLHANPIKLVYSLLRHGVVTLDAKNYTALTELYEAAKPLTAEQLVAYRKILAAMHLHPEAKGRILLIGDELADRGQNDLLMLLLFERMRAVDINYEILLSNHGAELLNHMKPEEDLISLDCIKIMAIILLMAMGSGAIRMQLISIRWLMECEFRRMRFQWRRYTSLSKMA